MRLDPASALRCWVGTGMGFSMFVRIRQLLLLRLAGSRVQGSEIPRPHPPPPLCGGGMRKPNRPLSPYRPAGCSGLTGGPRFGRNAAS